MDTREQETVKPEEFGNHFLQEDFESIYNQCVKEFRKQITQEDFITLAKSFNQGAAGYYLIHQSIMPGYTQYLWLDSREEKVICVCFADDTIIHHILLKPYLTFPESDNRYTSNVFVFPIKDEWFVFWGGKNEFLNYHYPYESQRYAYDLVIVKENSTYKSLGRHNEDFYAFNKEVTAPVDGLVIETATAVKDNAPRDMNEAQPAGNFIVLQHANNEYSLIAHFKQHSITVKVGEQVKQGQILGQCGNSGNSSEPHIHFQVMDAPNMNTSRSICIHFTDGKEPVQGEIARSN